MNGIDPEPLQLIHFNFKFPGVYFLFHGSHLQYIGSSLSNIGGRIWNHANDNFFEFDGVLWISNLLGNVNFDIRKLEKDLIMKLQPEFNVFGKEKSGRYSKDRKKRYSKTSNDFKDELSRMGKDAISKALEKEYKNKK